MDDLEKFSELLEKEGATAMVYPIEFLVELERIFPNWAYGPECPSYLHDEESVRLWNKYHSHEWVITQEASTVENLKNMHDLWQKELLEMLKSHFVNILPKDS